MRTAGKISALVFLLITLGIAVSAQVDERNIAERQRTSTVLGGTGLFNTFSTRTLYKGEFNFALFWDRSHRDPGDLRIDRVPFNFTIGLTDRWELWVNWVAWQRVRSSNPFLLSGYQYNAVRLFGDPFDILGPAIGGDDGAAFFPGSGAVGGGILPALGRFGAAVNSNGGSVFSPAGAGGPSVVGLGPQFLIDRPNFYNDLPFYGVVDFLGFDSLGRPVLGPRQKADGSGDVYAGTKYNLIDPNENWFSLALAGYVKIPISRGDQARARGRTSGEYEFGPVLIAGQEFADHRLRFYENIGYIHTTDVERRGVKVLDLRDKLLVSGGASFALNKHLELLAELSGTMYVGGGTPNFDPVDPWDLILGARFFFRDGSIAFGGAYRRLLNRSERRGDFLVPCVPVEPPNDCPHGDCHDKHTAKGGPPHDDKPPHKPPPPPCFDERFSFGRGDRNGFIGFISIGNRRSCPPPPVPGCVLEGAPGTVTRGERVSITLRPSTPGYSEAKLRYSYRWEVKDRQGRSVPVTGTDTTIDIPTAQLVCGSYSVTVTLTATADTDCGDLTGETTCSASFEVTEPPCPAVDCRIFASSTTVNEGERVTLRATTTGAEGPRVSWSTTGGKLSSTTGNEVVLDTTGITRSVIVTVDVSNNRTRCDQPCPGASCSITVNVRGLPPPEEPPEVIRPCGPIFFPFNSARINNEHKACLDDIALAMQQDPTLKLVADGHRDTSERAGISITRLNNAREYLVADKGIDRSRIMLRNFGDTCPHENGDSKLNGRVEFWLLPEGASVAQISEVKRCAVGSAPREVSGEQAAPSAEPRRPQRRTPRGRRPEPVSSDQTDDEDTEPVNRPAMAEGANGRAGLTHNTARRATASASVVRGVRTETSGGLIRIYVDADGALNFKDFTLKAPDRIVVDLAGVRFTPGSKTLGIAAGLVERVRIGEPSTGVVRIVIDLRQLTRYQVVDNGDSLIIIIGDTSVASSRDTQSLFGNK